MMDRRESIKTLIVAAGGLVALPAWADGWTKSNVSRHVSTFAVAEQETLTAAVDTIIPAGNSIGAITVGTDKFIQKLVDNCYEADARDNFKNGLKSLEARAKQAHQMSFAQCTKEQREILLLTMVNSTEKSDRDFFASIKGETIRGFNTSKEVMLQHLKYKIAPGHYYGCVDLKA